MKIEQGISIYNIDDVINDNNSRSLNEIYICKSFTEEDRYFIAKNRKQIVTEPVSLETAIKIAKLFNEDLKRGDV